MRRGCVRILGGRRRRLSRGSMKGSLVLGGIRKLLVLVFVLRS